MLHARQYEQKSELENHHTEYPISWYQIAWSYEIPIKAVKPIKICGLDLVLFRGEDGQVHVLDAHCPHLGAHLGIRGKVCGNQIKCGFHSWEFDGKGACKKIPSMNQVSSKIKINSWKVLERYDIIFIYFNPQSLDIDQDLCIPLLDSDDWGHPLGKRHPIHTRASDVLENGVDIGHFSSVHNVPMNGAKLLDREDGTLVFQHRTITKRLGLSFDTSMEIIYVYPGLQIIYLQSVLGYECVTLSSVTPVNEHEVVAHLTSRIRCKRNTLWTRFITRILSYCINTTFAEDIPIWDHKIYKDHPVLALGEDNIPRFRKWYKKFPKAYVKKKIGSY